MIGIIGAMDVEIELIKEKIVGGTQTEIGGVKFNCGIIDDVMVAVCCCSPGKVNAAIATQAMIDNFDVEEIINVGVGCSLSKDVVVKNIVVATDVLEYDIDITALGEPRGFINGLNRIKIETDKNISEKLSQIAINSGEKIHRGTIASGDTFISGSDMKKDLKDSFGAICGEMEGGAIGHVAASNGIPFAVIRSISDGGDENAAIDYPTFKEIAAKMSAKIILQYITTKAVQNSLFD